MQQKKRMPVGVDDFKKVREQYYFVDKTKFIQELIDGHSDVTLITRPRRFGKTLTMSMLYYFFANENAEENRKLFDGTEIAEAGEKYMAEQGTRPVVFLTLKDVKMDTWDGCQKKMGLALASLYDRFGALATSEKLSGYQKQIFAEVLNRKASAEVLEDTLQHLSGCLEAHYGQKTILLIDEYDAPIQSAWEHGYYEKAIGFFRNFLGAALKTNPSLEFAVLTGVLRISKESIFSALNNLAVSSVIDGSYADVFGFTTAEVTKMAKDLGAFGKVDEIHEWYDGYNFSGYEIYNPWSVVNYFQSGCKAKPYWVNTSGNGILADMLAHMDEEQERNLYELLQMRTIGIQVEESLIYDDIFQNKAALYTLLLTTGYLKTVPGVFDEEDNDYCMVGIPNREVRSVFAKEIVNRLQRSNQRLQVVAFHENLLAGKSEPFAKALALYLETIASFHDTANRENFYHGFMLGMLALLVPRYRVESNRESGYGRFDLAIFPKNKGQAGVLMEFKVAKTEAELPKEAEVALQQIEDMDYLAEFREQGVANVWKYGIAFYGKKLKLVCG